MSSGTEKPTDPIQRITIGDRIEDAALVEEIVRYQSENHLSSAADAVRALCEKALATKPIIEWSDF
jgi:hypothetical protein